MLALVATVACTSTSHQPPPCAPLPPADPSGSTHWTWEQAARERAESLVGAARRLTAAGDRQQGLACLDEAIAGVLNPPRGYEMHEAYLDFLAGLIAEARIVEAQSAPPAATETARRRARPAPPAVARHPEPLVPPSDLPLELNSRVGRFLEAATRPGDFRHRLQRGLDRAGSYLPMIRAKLAAAGLPQDLAYLPIIESSFSLTAHSRAGAHGMWQFMPATARQYGLRVSPHIDDRRDPIRSTDAAVAHLDRLHTQFGNWLLALAAYNGGATRVRQAVEQARSTDFWRIRRHLPRETRDYVPSFMAAVIVAKRPERYGLPAIAERGLIPDPASRQARAGIDRALTRVDRYVVQRHDTLWAIARFLGVGLDDLCAYNALGRDSVIHPGQMIQVPDPDRVSASAVRADR